VIDYNVIKLDPNTGRLSGVSFVASPNCDQRPKGVEIDLLVIHGISLPPGEFGSDAISDLFCNQLDVTLHSSFQELADVRVSAHALIRRDGAITQYVPMTERAWHAGVSSYQGQNACNDFSIGIELEGTDTVAYTLAQYQQLVHVIHAIQAVYPKISDDRIVGHSDIAPSRKTDPGPSFDWNLLRENLIKK
jgi:AmpD protein